MHAARLILPLLTIPALLGAAGDNVRVETGLLAGSQGSSPEVRVYKGIPYAAPPVGVLRWKAPKPPASWEGVRPAAEFGKVCYQTPYPANSVYFSAPEPMGEDCLYLNVWTAAASPQEKRPVMVWIYGGALTRGSGSLRVYDGEALARKGVVVVSFNYRLGIFGFFAHPELSKESDHNASGNYGLLDQIAALGWVHRNIAAFGGDPSRVTIFGESAGSWSVNYLMATPLAAGLFQRAIGESGGTFGVMPKLKEIEQAGVKFAGWDGADTIQQFRAKPPEDLVNVPAVAAFRPCVDGWLLKDDVYTIFANGKQNDVPLLIGFNADEGRSLAPWPPYTKAARFIDQARTRLGARTEEFLKLYPAESDQQAEESHYASFRDLTFGWQMRTWARMQTKSGKSKTYLYYFTRVPPGPESARYRAYHAAEIAYVFRNLNPPRPWEDADRKLADLVSSYWVNFARTGDPNGKGLPTWPEYQEKTDLALELGDTVQPRPAVNKASLDFWDRYMQAERSRGR